MRRASRSVARKLTSMSGASPGSRRGREHSAGRAAPDNQDVGGLRKVRHDAVSS
jgi:hypothetical protein